MNAELVSRISDLILRLEGWCTVEKAVSLAKAVAEIRPRCCVEIGVFGGRSLFPMALACQSLKSGHVFGIDPWSPTQALEGLSSQADISFWNKLDYEEIYRQCQKVIADEDLSRYCTLIRSSSVECRTLFSEIDVLHIDGNHHRESAIRDVQIYLPKVLPGGQIWFDDADWESTQEAVKLLFAECDVIQDFGSFLQLRKRGGEIREPRLEQTLQPAERQNSGRRRILVHSGDKRLGFFCGGVYNPGAAVFNDQMILVARNEKYSELDRQNDGRLCPNSCRPVAIHLNAQGHVVDLQPLSVSAEIEAGRAEDFRVFRFEADLLVSFSRVYSASHICIEVGRLNLQQHRLESFRTPRVDFAVNLIEKNWCFFPHDGSLFLLYSFLPFRILKLTDRETFQFETILNMAPDERQLPPAIVSVPRVSLSTAPINFDGELLFFVHTRDESGVYRQFAAGLDPTTLSPSWISRSPVFSGGEAFGLRPPVLYLMSVIENEKEFWFFFGEGDEHVSCVKLSHHQLHTLTADKVKLEMRLLRDEDLFGEYQYEHVGHFHRMVSLNADGTIRNGGEHDHGWRLNWQADQRELWILGSAGLSCRMQELQPGFWQGMWNLGSRPIAKLRRIVNST